MFCVIIKSRLKVLLCTPLWLYVLSFNKDHGGDLYFK
jgi:hypothetical protein